MGDSIPVYTDLNPASMIHAHTKKLEVAIVPE